MRIEVTEDSVDVLLSRWQKILGLLGDIRVPRGDVSDVQVVEDPVREAMGIGRTFAEAFLKAMRSRELDPGAATPWQTLADVPEGVHPFFQEEIGRIQEALLEAVDIHRNYEVRRGF